MHCLHRAGGAGGDAVFHLHGFEHQQPFARRDALPGYDIDGEHPARHRRVDAAIAGAGHGIALRRAGGEAEALPGHAHIDRAIGHHDMAVGHCRAQIGADCRARPARRADFGNAVEPGDTPAVATRAQRQAVQRVAVPQPDMAFLGQVEPEAAARKGRGSSGSGISGFRQDQRQRSEQQRRFGHGRCRRQRFGMAGDEAGIDLAGAEGRVVGEPREEGAVGFKPFDNRAVERADQPVDGGGAVGAPGDDLGDHRVEIQPDAAAGFDAGIDAHAFTVFVAGAAERHAGAKRQPRQRAGGGQEAAFGIFGIEPRLDGMAGDEERILVGRQHFAARDAQLPFDEIMAGDRLGDRVLDLEAGVHLHEVKGRVTLGIDRVEIEDELHRASAFIADGMGGSGCGDTQDMAQAFRQAGGRGFLDDLLVAALQRTIAFEQVDDIAMAVGKDLHFDMARALDQLFEHDAGIAEAGLAFALGGHQRVLEVRRIMHGAHALAATTGNRLDEQRIAHAFGGALEPDERLVIALIAGGDRHAGLFHRRFGAVL